MGHRITWDNEDETVVLQEYTDGATKSDFHQLVKESSALLKTVQHTVHLIIDERKILLILESSDATLLKKWLPENEGTVVVVMPPARIEYRRAFQFLSKQLLRKNYANTYSRQFTKSLTDLN
jgi:hypothetical protein